MAAILGLLAACAGPPSNSPAPGNPGAPSPPPGMVSVPMVNPTIVRPRARWVPVEWADLPGWQADSLSELWPALLRGCERPAPAWLAACAQARGEPTAPNDATVRAWLQRRLKPYRVEALDGASEGLVTG